MLREWINKLDEYWSEMDDRRGGDHSMREC